MTRNAAYFGAISLSVILLSCSSSPRYTVGRVPGKSPARTSGKKETSRKTLSSKDKPPIGKRFRGLASFYADDFHNKKTANGETYDMYGLTAAHRTLPFNTWLQVKNLSNQRTVIIRVNDRGPFIKGRIIDLSYGAAKELDMIGKGIQKVEILVLY